MCERRKADAESWSEPDRRAARNSGALGVRQERLGLGGQRIAEHLGVHRNTVRSLIRKERQVRAAERTAGDAEAAIARYEKVVERA